MEAVPSKGSRVLITGSGVLCAGVSSTEELWERALIHRKAIGKISPHAELASSIGLSPGDASIVGRHQLLALSAVHQAWNSAGLGGMRNRLRGEGEKVRHPDYGCVGGSSLGGLVAMESDCSSGDRFSPYAISRWRGNAVSAVVSLRHGLGASVLSVHAASATGAQILWMAGTLIKSGMAELIVAVAADAEPTPLVSKAMGRNGSISPDDSSTPLSLNRSGMRPAEGAACLILESEHHAASRGALPLAEWVAGACANEARHLQAPDPEGAVLESLIRKTLRFVPEGNVDWISLHATGTPRYDAAEVAVLGRVFGRNLPGISAFKGIAGHTLSASGLLEAALLVEGLRRQKIPPGSRTEEGLLGSFTMPESNIPRCALQLAGGMGGDVVVNLLVAMT